MNIQREPTSQREFADQKRRRLLGHPCIREALAKLPVEASDHAVVRDITRHLVFAFNDALTDTDIECGIVCASEGSPLIDAMYVYEGVGCVLVPLKLTNCTATVGSQTVLLAHKDGAASLAKAIAGVIVAVELGELE